MSTGQTIKIVVEEDEKGSETVQCPCCDKPQATGGYMMGGSYHYFCWNCDTSIWTDSDRTIVRINQEMNESN